MFTHRVETLDEMAPTETGDDWTPRRRLRHGVLHYSPNDGGNLDMSPAEMRAELAKFEVRCGLERMRLDHAAAEAERNRSEHFPEPEPVAAPSIQRIEEAGMSLKAQVDVQAILALFTLMTLWLLKSFPTGRLVLLWMTWRLFSFLTVFVFGRPAFANVVFQGIGWTLTAVAAAYVLLILWAGWFKTTAAEAGGHTLTRPIWTEEGWLHSFLASIVAGIGLPLALQWPLT